jgi:hypothetical protein
MCQQARQPVFTPDKLGQTLLERGYTAAEQPRWDISLSAAAPIPKSLSTAEVNSFNREYMARCLKLETLCKKTGRVDWAPEESFPSDRFFCMAGTNRADYEAAMGLSRAFAGHGSDGLVRIEDASVWGVNAKGQVSAPCATAYTYRSHSGCFGIVNSEEAYQNLTRFLFGDIRVDIWVDAEAVQSPPEIQGKLVGPDYLAVLLGTRIKMARVAAEGPASESQPKPKRSVSIKTALRSSTFIEASIDLRAKRFKDQ